MTVKVEAGTLSFEQFWKWLQRHTNCIIRVGNPDCYLYDHDDLHWHLDRDDQGGPVVELVWGKKLIADLSLELREVLFVEIVPDEQPGHYLFEVIGGPKDDPLPVYSFLLSHGYEEESSAPGHPLKH